MTSIATEIPNLTLEAPNPDLDAPFAYEWFSSDYGIDTLLKMGNALHEIESTSLETERETIVEFLELEKKGIQKTWMIHYKEKTIGAAWIDLVKNHGVEPPSVHLMIGDPSCRGKGIGRAVMCSMIKCLRNDGEKTIYSRHLTNNDAIIRLNDTLGFEKDGTAYVDINGLEWQNVSLRVEEFSS